MVSLGDTVAHHEAKPASNRIRTIWLLGALLCMLSIVIVVTVFFGQHTQKSDHIVDTQPLITMSEVPTVAPSSAEEPASPVSVAPTAPVSPSPTPVTETYSQPVVAPPIPLRAEPTRIVIPDARIDMNVLPLPQSSIEAGVLTPPETPDAYWVRAFDQPGADSTDMTMIVSHACESLPICDQMDWQFNRLSDNNLLKLGTVITVKTKNGAVCYAADSAPVVYAKPTLQDEVAVFGNAPRPDKLVLVSCYTADTIGKNVVVVATRQSC